MSSADNILFLYVFLVTYWSTLVCIVLPGMRIEPNCCDLSAGKMWNCPSRRYGKVRQGKATTVEGMCFLLPVSLLPGSWVRLVVLLLSGRLGSATASKAPQREHCVSLKANQSEKPCGSAFWNKVLSAKNLFLRYIYVAVGLFQRYCLVVFIAGILLDIYSDALPSMSSTTFSNYTVYFEFSITVFCEICDNVFHLSLMYLATS